jgi:hypothetical protein
MLPGRQPGEGDAGAETTDLMSPKKSWGDTYFRYFTFVEMIFPLNANGALSK